MDLALGVESFPFAHIDMDNVNIACGSPTSTQSSAYKKLGIGFLL